MRTIRFLLFILLCFTLTCAWADVAPRPWGRTPGPDKASRRLSGNRQVKASMADADVQVHISSGRPRRPGNEAPLSADVRSEFDIVCSAAPEEGKDLDLVFPMNYTDEAAPSRRSFSVTIDGKPAAAVKTTTWSVTDENNKPRTQWGYTWRLLGLKGGQKRRIAVRYSLVLPQIEGKAHFTYILRSGAYWDGPIGQEVVNVSADKGLRMEVLTPVELKPEQRTDTSLTWRITKAKPAEDIRLVIVPDAKP